jgi:hypothetical protein
VSAPRPQRSNLQLVPYRPCSEQHRIDRGHIVPGPLPSTNSTKGTTNVQSMGEIPLAILAGDRLKRPPSHNGIMGGFVADPELSSTNVSVSSEADVASVPSLKSLEFRRRSVGCFSRRERSAHICVIRVERATRKNSQLAAARRVALKMGRRLRCSSVTYRSDMRPLTASPARTALPAAHFERNETQGI